MRTTFIRRIRKSIARPILAARLGGVFLALPLLATPAFGGDAGEGMAQEDFILIAHRGVVTDTTPPNSLAALEEAIARGYSHVEVDLGATKDGHAVCIHDDSLRSATGRGQRVTELTLEELRALVPVETVPDFATFCARSEQRIGLMLDIKWWPAGAEDAFKKSIETSMRKHGLMKDAYFIGKSQLARDFENGGRRKLRTSLEEVQESGQQENRLGDEYFAFGRAAKFDAASVTAYQELGLKVIVSINAFHYLTSPDWEKAGNEDVRRMLEYGVDGLQIDCAYEPAVRAHFE